MRRSWYELYTLIVCLSSLTGIVGTLCGLVYAVIAWTDPELMVGSHAYGDHQTNERYWERHYREYRQQTSETGKPSDEEIPRRRLASYESHVEGVRRFGKLFTILNSFGVVLAGVIFAIHWRLSKQARKIAAEASP